MNIILRRRKLGRGSAAGIKAVATSPFSVVRNWVDSDWPETQQPGEPLFLFRWGCTSTVHNGLGETVVVNTSAAIHWCSDKRQGRLDMQAAGVSVPETWTYNNFIEFVEDEDDELYVLRPAQHAQGRNLLVLKSDEIRSLISPLYESGYVARLINKVAEYRVYVIQGRVACIASKTPADASAVAWNVAQGGRFDNVKWQHWPLAAIKEALAAAKVGRLDFCGVDVMMDAEGKAYVLEVNSAPSLTSPYRQSCFAKCFDYIINNGKAQLAVDNVINWKSVIHPAIWEE